MRELLIEYEQARQDVCRLDKKRMDLYTNCEKHNEEYADICICVAYNSFQKEQKNLSWGDFYQTFSEFFEEGVADGLYCKNCSEAYRIKPQDLAEAKKRFGIVKRKLSALGKRLINENKTKTVDTTTIE